MRSGKEINKLLVMAIVGTAIFSFAACGSSGNKTESITGDDAESAESASLDNAGTAGLAMPENPSEADEYYWENSTVLEVIDANTSEDVPTEAEVIEILEDRGFTDYSVSYEYTMDGEYVQDTEIGGSSSEKRPMYYTYFVSDQGDVWTVFVINGEVFANPASFNLDSELGAQLLISETGTLTSYDHDTGQYYVTIPKETAVILKTVDRIDADTLNGLTSEEIMGL